jgi:Acyclic terpene utilisation family protein AtuA
MSALAEMVLGGPVDVVTGDYLAEVTMLVLARTRLRRPGGGYAGTFLRQLEPVAAEVAERGIKIVVNAGGLDPGGLALATREMLDRLGLDLKVAHVEGDDLSDLVPGFAAEGQQLANADSGAPFSTWDHDVLTANAYLGGFGIKAALDAGADIVVTGRVADASLVSGVAAWWWGWSPADLDQLAGAVAAGHIIECGTQATGGNFSGFLGIDDLTHPGFPIAEVDGDGSSEITKHDHTGGAVTVDTITAQLLYEVGSPEYLNPDVVVHLDTITLDQTGPDKVAVTGAKGTPPPPTTKVAITGVGIWRNNTTVVLTGLDIDAKASLFERSVRDRLEGSPGIDDLRFTRIGLATEDPHDQMSGSCLLQIAVDGAESECGRPFSSFIVELALSNFPGIYLTDVPGNGSPAGAYWPGLVDQALVAHQVVFDDGSVKSIAPPPRTEVAPSRQPTEPDPSPQGTTSFGPELDAPLGLVVNARSGDKGGNANLGLWVGTSEAWGWLSETMTVDCLRTLAPEIAGLRIDRFELPNLSAINFVIHGLLDGGATEARRFDKQAKALGEWIRARYLKVPANLLDRDD